MPTKIITKRGRGGTQKCGCGRRATTNHAGSPCCDRCYEIDTERLKTRRDVVGRAATRQEHFLLKEMNQAMDKWFDKRGLPRMTFRESCQKLIWD